MGRKGTGWWGMLTLIATEASLFGYLLFSYAFTAVQNGAGFLPPKLPALHLAGPNTAILLLSSVAVWWGERGIKCGSRGRFLLGISAAILLGAVFVAIQLLEWRNKHLTLASSAWASHYFTITGFHMAHVVLGLVGLITVLVWGTLGYFDRRRHTGVMAAALYWHFVDAVWLAVFTTFYIAPYLGAGR
jgi:heme/copper-type cytochrome/quinol oxidase subunit 3